MDPIFLLSPLRSLVRRVRLCGSAPAGHPEAEAPLALPRRIDGPAAAAQLARDLLRHRREDITLVIYLDERHRLVGTAIVAVGWAQAARLAARPVLAGALACRAASCVVIRYGRWRGPQATDQDKASFDALSAACSRSGLPVIDHLVVVGNGASTSASTA